MAENFRIDEKGESVLISINPGLYGLDAIYAAAYKFIDKYYVLIDGDPREEVVVSIRPKKGEADFSNIAMEFNNELISYMDYFLQVAKNNELRNLIVKKALEYEPNKDKQ